MSEKEEMMKTRRRVPISLQMHTSAKEEREIKFYKNREKRKKKKREKRQKKKNHRQDVCLEYKILRN